MKSDIGILNGQQEQMATESQSLETTTPPRTTINQLGAHVGDEVTINGWLYNLRSSGKMLFPQLRDGTGVVQCVPLQNTQVMNNQRRRRIVSCQ